MASTIFVKKPERVEALLFIMTTCLTVYAAIEHRIRQQLEQNDLTFPNQLGKQVKNPTARWVFQCFSNISLLFNDTIENPLILNSNFRFDNSMTKLFLKIVKNVVFLLKISIF